MDIKQPNTKWQRRYAQLESDRIKWYNLWNYVKHIPVEYEKEYVCIYCGEIDGGLKCELEAERADEAWKNRD